MVRPISNLKWYDGAASGQQRSALMRLQPSRVMISYATSLNTPWDNSFHSRDQYTLFVDSGGYHQMMTGKGEYNDRNYSYLDYIEKHDPSYWTLRDFPCEPSLLDKLDRTVVEHQRRTVEEHAALLDLADDRGIRPEPVAVLQGWEMNDYLEHIDDLRDRGCLTDYVGIGSICRRHETDQIVNIILSVREALPSSVKLHAFGVKNSVLQFTEVVDALWSADSSAYDFAASQKGERLEESFSYRDSLWSWLCWRRKLYRQIGSQSYEDSATASPKESCHHESLRDRIWSSTLELLRSAQSRFTISDIVEQAGLSDSQRQTVRNTLSSMASFGWLKHKHGSIYWLPGPKATAELQ